MGIWTRDIDGISGTYVGNSVASIVIIGLFPSLAIYNVIELLILIYGTFTRFRGLYFWSLIISSLGIVPYALGLMLKLFGVIAPVGAMVMVVVGWIAMVSGQSFVLWSRLHLVVHGPRGEMILKYTKWLIVIDMIILQIPTSVCAIGANLNNPAIINAYNVMEKIELTGFFIQETILSTIYIVQVSQILKTSVRQNTRRTMKQLILINAVIIIMDIALVSVEAASLYILQTVLKAACYSVKLKLEFAILSKLVQFVASPPVQLNRPIPALPPIGPDMRFDPRRRNTSVTSRSETLRRCHHDSSATEVGSDPTGEEKEKLPEIEDRNDVPCTPAAANDKFHSVAQRFGDICFKMKPKLKRRMAGESNDHVPTNEPVESVRFSPFDPTPPCFNSIIYTHGQSEVLNPTEPHRRHLKDQNTNSIPIIIPSASHQPQQAPTDDIPFPGSVHRSTITTQPSYPWQQANSSCEGEVMRSPASTLASSMPSPASESDSPSQSRRHSMFRSHDLHEPDRAQLSGHQMMQADGVGNRPNPRCDSLLTRFMQKRASMEPTGEDDVSDFVDLSRCGTDYTHAAAVPSDLGHPPLGSPYFSAISDIRNYTSANDISGVKAPTLKRGLSDISVQLARLEEIETFLENRQEQLGMQGVSRDQQQMRTDSDDLEAGEQMKGKERELHDPTEAFYPDQATSDGGRP